MPEATPALKPRINIQRDFPQLDGESDAAWTERLTREAARHGVYRQCSIGWHDECSQRRKPGPECPCNCSCHTETPEDGSEAATGAPLASQGPTAVAESLRAAQAAVLRDWAATSEAEIDDAELTPGADGWFVRGVRSAIENALRRADDIEVGTYTVTPTEEPQR